MDEDDADDDDDNCGGGDDNLQRGIWPCCNSMLIAH